MSERSHDRSSALCARSWARIFGVLLQKEWLQMLRDPAIIFMGTLLPVILILLFGWGLSMDLNKVPVAFTSAESTPLTNEIRAALRGSPYFDVVEVHSRKEAEALFAARRVEAVMDLPPGLTKNAASGLSGAAEIGLTIHGVDASAASIIRTYAAAAIAGMSEKITLREDFALMGSSGGSPAAMKASGAAQSGSAALISRSWFNEANTSSWYLVPGLAVVVLTLSSSFLGAVIIAREWERGTLETLSVTPAPPAAILGAKFLVNFLLTAAGAVLVYFAATLVFGVPVRGSLGLLAAVVLVYSAWAIAFGLLLSAVFKSQFTAIQLAVIGSYLPSLMLSGYLFDLRSVPWFISAVGALMPPTYAIESVKILCLSGGPEGIVLSNLCILGAAALVFLLLALLFARKRLD